MIRTLHGFLGTPADWDFLPLPHESVDVLSSRARSMPEWASAFNASEAEDGDVLIGYSMGGRLALHALVDAARTGGVRYGAAVIVSAGLGVEGEAERGARRQRDAEWARRFVDDPWDEIVSGWNRQAIFGGRAIPSRAESSFDRGSLARVLVEWSPAMHESLAAELPEIEVRTLWIAGEDDPAYVAVARRAAELMPDAEVWICPDAAHRVPWDRPEAFTERVRAFLRC